jgi:hypothetical protein
LANTIKMKQSAVASKVPLTTDLSLGELAINTNDGKLFLKKNVSSVESIVEVSADKLPLTGGSLSGGLVVVQPSTTADGLRVTLSDSGATGNAIVVEDSANPDATPWLVDATGTVIHGHTTNITSQNAQSGVTNAVSGKLQMTGLTTQFGTHFQAVWNSTAGAAPALVMAKSNGATVGAYTATTTGDTLGFLSWQGADGAAFIRSADIRAVVNGTVSTGIVPGSLVFRVANTSGTLTDRLVIAANGTHTVTGTLNATTLQEGGVNLSTKYALAGSGGTASFVSMAKWGTD